MRLKPKTALPNPTHPPQWPNLCYIPSPTPAFKTAFCFWANPCTILYPKESFKINFAVFKRAMSNLLVTNPQLLITNQLPGSNGKVISEQ
jgi:hypothetical protein